MEHHLYGDKIRHVRQLRGYSQEYMAERLGLGGAKAYQRYESGEARLDLDRLEAIAGVLEMTVPGLLSFDEKMVFHQCNQDHSVFGNGNHYHDANAKLVEELQARIKHQEEEIAFLRRQVEELMQVRK